jgi:hypothetical protein
MNLRNFCRLPNFPMAILTTYNIDPLFFERVVLYDLAAGGSSRIFVLADYGQAMPLIAKARGQLMALGRRYRLIPVQMKGAFHPKVCVRIGPTQAVVATGSHNLTRSGWLGRSSDQSGGNRESTVGWRVLPDTPRAIELSSNIKELIGLLELASDREELGAQLASTWLKMASEENTTPPDPAWKVFGRRKSLASELEQRWRGRRFERLQIVAGSTDNQAAMIRWAAETFGIVEAVVEIDREFCSFDPVALADLPVTLRIKTYDGNPRTHLKAALFESAGGNAAVVGSANCSGSAWLRTAAEGGNIESVVIYDDCGPSGLAQLFRANQGEASHWQDVELSPPKKRDDPPPQKLRLRQLQLQRSGGTLHATLESSPGKSDEVFVIVQSSRVPMTRTQDPNVWRGPLPDITSSPETLFGHLEINDGGLVEVTNAVWIDDNDYLAEVAGRRLPFGAVPRLSSMTISEDYKRLLDDLQLLSKALLSQPSEFPDNLVPGQRAPKPAKPVSPEKPVTVADVIVSLDQLASSHTGNPLSSLHLGSVSLTGIMRLLFGGDIHNVESDPTEIEGKKGPGKETPPEDPNPVLPPPNTEDVGPTPKQRQRLLEQLRLFKSQLSERSFAEICSARQLQQAAAYPLAVAQFAARGPWIEQEDRWPLAEIVRGVCETLFCRMIRQKDAKTGKSWTRPPLVMEVRERYTKEERVSDFDQIIGDGTLWLVVMGSLAMMDEDPEMQFARSLALSDVAQLELLSSNVIPEHLAPLAGRLWQSSPAGLAEKIKRLVAAVNDLEQYISSHFDGWKPTLVSSAQVGDWLWNPKVAFAQVIEMKDSGKAKIHVRKRSEDITVQLSYYLNLRDISSRDATLWALFAACFE